MLEQRKEGSLSLKEESSALKCFTALLEDEKRVVEMNEGVLTEK